MEFDFIIVLFICLVVALAFVNLSNLAVDHLLQSQLASFRLVCSIDGSNYSP